MGDRHRIFYIFDQSWQEGDLKALVEFLNHEYEIEAPVKNACDSVRTADKIENSRHYVEELTDGTGYLIVGLPNGPDCSLQYNVKHDSPAVLGPPNLYLSIPDHRFFSVPTGEKEADAVAAIDEVYTLLADLYEHFVNSGRPPVYVYGLMGEDERRIASQEYDITVSEDRIKNDRMPSVFWCQILPPAVVENVGEQTLLSAPVHRVERLADGAVLLVLHGFPTDIVETGVVADHLDVPYDAPEQP